MFQTVNILIVDDDDAIVKVFERVVKDKGWSYLVARSGTEAVEILNKNVIEAAVVDINLPGYTGIQVLEYCKANNLHTEVIIITGVGGVDTAVQAIRLGAYDYLTKPFDDIHKVIISMEKCIDKYRIMQKLRRLEHQGGDASSYEGIVGKSKKMQEVFGTIDSVASSTATVMILGESGTGKELVAQAIHHRSKRADKPFVVINCAALPETLLESELFGHKKGSFTGAIGDKKGLFEEAHGGSIFLDEIGEIPLAIQVKLLRAIQEGEVRAIGSNQNSHVDVRLIAATNRDLAQCVKNGSFREDLYYRLNVIGVLLPPLRDRSEDIPLLAYHFLQKYARKCGKDVTKISLDALQTLQGYAWVGNVRELENVIERAVVLVDGDTVHARNLPPRLLGETFYLSAESDDEDLVRFSYQEAKDRALDMFNRTYIANVLKHAEGNLSVAAQKAGMDRSNFKKIVRRYNVDADEFKAKGKPRED